MDSGYTKVALPFSVNENFILLKTKISLFLKVSKVWSFQSGLIIERQS